MTPRFFARASRLTQTVFLLGALAGGVAPISASAGYGESFDVDPGREYFTIESDHFLINYPTELDGVARRAAELFERAHALLSPVLKWEPSRRTPVLLLLNTDSGNGLTSPILHIGIILYLAAPDAQFSTAYYDDWLWAIVLHEYAHFLNMDNTQEGWKLIRILTGDLVTPNSLWAPWMLEGLAVEMETRFTKSGRGRSPYYRMTVRAGIEEQKLDSDDWITLDRIAGTYPWHPTGESQYLFGYFLMHALLEQKGAGPELLGDLSTASGGRVPYFINGNLENVAGRNWYQVWRDWVESAEKQAAAELATIRSQALTKPVPITTEGGHAYGAETSPDGRWLAYTHDSADFRSGLYVRDLRRVPLEQSNRRLLDKQGGVGLGFTRDSRWIVFSALRRASNYGLFSDVGAVDTQSGRTVWLVSGKRAKDPHVGPSLDGAGQTVVFVVTDGMIEKLVSAPLTQDSSEGLPTLDDDWKTLFTTADFGRISGPRLSPDGRLVAFAVQPNETLGEDLVVMDLATGATSTLVADSFRNRYPAFLPNGDLAFVSDRTGVDNVYVWREGQKPTPLTNLTSGVWFPTFDRDGNLYASVFSTDGWNIARLLPLETPVDETRITLPRETAPSPEPAAATIAVQTGSQPSYEGKPYSVWPSILPRYWYPTTLLELLDERLYLGGKVAGYDAIDRHRYAIGLGVDTEIGKLDWDLVYKNRSLGPLFGVSASNLTSQIGTLNRDLLYVRRLRAEVSGEKPFRFTYNTVFLGASAAMTRDTTFVPTLAGGAAYDRTAWIPHVDGNATYQSSYESRLGVAPESGSLVRGSVRHILDANGPSAWRAFSGLSTYHSVGPQALHWSLLPSLAAAYASRMRTTAASSAVVTKGRDPSSVIQSGSGSGPDNLVVRGYPEQVYRSRAAAVGSLDLRFPIARLFRGLGTNPFFLENLFGGLFTELAYVPDPTLATATLASSGAGVSLETRFFHHLPAVFSIEYHQGFSRRAGGRAELFLSASARSLNLF